MNFATNDTSTTFGATQQRRQAFADISNTRQFFPSQNNSKANTHHQVPIKKINNVPIITSAHIGSAMPPVSNLQAPGHPPLRNPTSYQHTGRASNIDERDRDDPLSVAEYAQDMYKHFREKESSTSARPNYMTMQPQITEKMRAILIDWLVNVQVQLKMGVETIYLAVNIIDRYLEQAEVPRSKLQLVGATSIFIAAKYEEVYNCPRIHDIVVICDNLYSHREIVQMETTILRALGFKISVPTAHTFLVRYLKAGHADEAIALLACYILEGTLTNYSLLQYLPSQLAAASTLIARHATNRNPWSPTLLKYTDYYEEDVIPIANAILEAKACTGPEITAVTKKYSQKRYKRVAKIDLSFIW